MSGDELERALGPAEALFWLGDQITRYNVIAYAEVEGALDAAALTPALAAVQARYPRLGTWIETPADFAPCFRRTDAAIPLRVASGGDWIAEINRELEQRFEPHEAPGRCVLVPLAVAAGAPPRHMLLFVFNHAIGDGMSATYIVRDLLTATQAPAAAGATSQALVRSRDFGPLESLMPAAGGAARIVWEVLKLTFRIVKKNGGVWLNNDVVLRLQVDDSEEPLKELRRVVEKWNTTQRRRR